MATGNFLSVKPQIVVAGLLEGELLILAVVATDEQI